MYKKINIIYFIIFLIFVKNNSIAQSSNEIIDNAILDNTLPLTGKIVKDDDLFILFFFDKYETDSNIKFLQNRGYHGGGPSWIAMIYTIFNDYETNIIDNIDFEVQASGITFKTKNKEYLLMISRAIYILKTNEKIMIDVIEKAKKLGIMK